MVERKCKKSTGNKKLTLAQQRFCELYATDREFFGNGVQSYAEAFNKDITKKSGYSTARTEASKLLTYPNILVYINELLDLTLNDAHVDKQLAFLITQSAELGVKLGAVREFNALKQRITKKFEGAVSIDQPLIEPEERLKWLQERVDLLKAAKAAGTAIADG